MVNWEQVINEMELPELPNDIEAVRAIRDRLGPEQWNAYLLDFYHRHVAEVRPTLDDDIL